ncbi:MAG: EFR1 family ferrodoxin [Eubacteriales bacterium]|nr:EFR1 family ferrodoxin [Eubacteriales bacterium]
MVFYFTATGNSLYAARQLDDTLVSIPQAIHDPDKVYRAERIGIVCPVFGHEVPPLVKDFLSKATFQTDYLYLILTYGNRHGGAAELALRMMAERELRPAYLNLVLMADNFLPGFDMDEQRKLDKKVEEQLEKIREDIQERKVFIPSVTERDRAVHRQYLKQMADMPKDSLVKAYHITEDCIGCSICTKICPMNCFTMDGSLSVWNAENCMMCMACIHACPMMAIQLRIPEKNPKARYRNEHVSICEIIASNNQQQEIC